jgi:hypothetical protein
VSVTASATTARLRHCNELVNVSAALVLSAEMMPSAGLGTARLRVRKEQL